jgi:hypothetical protein
VAIARYANQDLYRLRGQRHFEPWEKRVIWAHLSRLMEEEFGPGPDGADKPAEE